MKNLDNEDTKQTKLVCFSLNSLLSHSSIRMQKNG